MLGKSSHQSQSNQPAKSAHTSPSIDAPFQADRGQTLFDFLLGVVLFLGVVSFTIVLIPGIVDPFVENQTPSSAVADQGADHLTHTVLKEKGGNPYELEPRCTRSLFNGNAVTGCGTETNDLQQIVGMTSEYSANVQIIGDDGDVAELNNVRLEYGEEITTNTDNVYTSTRIVSLKSKRVRLVYSVW